MAKRLALKARLDRLEKRQLRHHGLKRTIICARTDLLDGDCVGVTDEKVHFTRLPLEPLEALTRRAAKVTGSRFLFLVYRPQASAEDVGALETSNPPRRA